MATFLALYAVGMAMGLAANIVLDVQLRRPGLRQGLGLLLFLGLMWGILSVTHTAFTTVIKPLLWAGTGILVGLGSREAPVHG